MKTRLQDFHDLAGFNPVNPEKIRKSCKTGFTAWHPGSS